jgi:hypothetical protein
MPLTLWWQGLTMGGRALARVARLRRGMAPARVRTPAAAPAFERLRHGGVFLKKKGLTMELKNALTTSLEASLLSKHIMYSITAGSHGNVILPSSLANPYPSCDMLRSSMNTVVPRYASGTSNRLPSSTRHSGP